MVRKTLSRIKNRYGDKNEKYKLIPQEPKTEKSKRLIPIPQSLIPLFQAHKAVQELEKAESFDLYTDNKTVFCTDTGKAEWIFSRHGFMQEIRPNTLLMTSLRYHLMLT